MLPDFPKDAALQVGRAILNKQLTADLIDPICVLIAYAAKAVLAGRKPVFGATTHGYAEADLASMLVDAGRPPVVDGDGFASGEPDFAAIPWTVVLPLLLDLVKRLIESRKAA